MEHFLRKKSIIEGAGGGGGGGGAIVISPPSPPPPAQLEPPKLGALQSLASYSYAETIDMISDGPIDGIVNQNGQYVQGHRIFEGIYFDNVPVKKSIDSSYSGTSAIASAEFSLSGEAGNLYNLWFRSGEFIGKDFTGASHVNATGGVEFLSGRYGSSVLKTRSYFANYAPVNDPYTCLTYSPVTSSGSVGDILNCPVATIRENQFELTWERDDIAKSIYNAIDLISTVADSPSSFGSDGSQIASAKKLRFDYSSWVDVKDGLLSFDSSKDDSDYPFFAVKINFGDPFPENVTNHCSNTVVTFQATPRTQTVSSDFSIDEYTNTILLEDIRNQAFSRIEIDDLSSSIKYGAMNYLDLTYSRKTSSTELEVGGSIILFGAKNDKAPTQESVQSIKDFLSKLVVLNYSNEKYNYNNVLAEARMGDEFQTPLAYFRKVYVSKEYSVKLAGPFNVNGSVFRVANFADPNGYATLGYSEVPLAENANGEGSTDNRSGKSFSSYAGNNKSTYVEAALPITHIIENNNVDQVYVTIGVRALSDTNQVEQALTGIGDVQVGAKIPTAIRFTIEWGLQDSFGKEVSSSVQKRVYQVSGVADNAVLIDLGREENSSIVSKYSFVAASNSSGALNASSGIILPSSESGKKRFIRITRTTYESSSVLIRREISLEKITEVINTPFSYPGSAIIGTKIDSRNISTIPPRSFDARLKRVFVPSNYYPLKPNGEDKRRYKTADDFALASQDDLQIYKGNWDGTFKELWTDNPAWVLFDLLINRDYGLGNFIDPRQINVWELYKIGQFCDGVNRSGVFSGVLNSFGGREPRYSINIILGDRIDVFQTINSVAASFRGSIYYHNGEINFADDRLKIPSYDFSNANVKDGLFSYSSSRRDQGFNVIEVAYLDENDDFKSKVEYIENVDSIRKRGVLKTTYDSFGVTSKSLANRIGRHILFGTIDENESASFSAGMDAMMIKPGDLININDELKTQQRNFGRVLDLDVDSRTVRLNEKFQEGVFLSDLTLVCPSGGKSWDEIYGKARYSGGLTFEDLYSNDVPISQSFKITGFDNSPEYGSNVYIGSPKTYEQIMFTGLSQVGLAGLRTGLYSGAGSFSGYTYFSGIGQTSGYSVSRSGTHWYLRAVASGNVVTSGSSGASYPTGIWATGGAYDVSYVENGNIDFLQNVQVGSPYSVSVSGIPKDVYKVASIREVSPNEFEVAAIKFNSGKFAEIEASQNIDDFYSTFSFLQRPRANAPVSVSQQYQLGDPTILAFAEGAFGGASTTDISGSWTAVDGAENYYTVLTKPNGSKVSSVTTSTSYVLLDQDQVGFYRLSVSAKNQTLGYTSKSTSASLTILPSASLITPYIVNITIA
jgi:hypothetical protein